MNISTISKYFWGLKEQALKQTVVILKNPEHPRFPERMVTFLSRCDKPKELFSLFTEEEFIEFWPKVRLYWMKISPRSDFRVWWDTIYDQILEKYGQKIRRLKGKAFNSFFKLGDLIRKARLEKGLSQHELAFKVGMRQPDISKIEKGEKNITMVTLFRLSRVLDIKRIEL